MVISELIFSKTYDEGVNLILSKLFERLDHDEYFILYTDDYNLNKFVREFCKKNDVSEKDRKKIFSKLLTYHKLLDETYYNNFNYGYKWYMDSYSFTRFIQSIYSEALERTEDLTVLFSYYNVKYDESKDVTIIDFKRK